MSSFNKEILGLKLWTWILLAGAFFASLFMVLLSGIQLPFRGLDTNRAISSNVGYKSNSLKGGMPMGISREEDAMMAPMPPYYDDMDVTSPNRSQVYSAYFSAEVKDVPQAVGEMTSYTESIGGIITSSSMSKRSNKYTASLGLRVPKDKFQETTQKIRELSDEIISEEVSMHDQTGQVSDIEERLNTLHEQLAEYQALLEEAETSADEIRIQRQIDSLERQIESIESQQKSLTDRAEMSSIQVNFSTYSFKLPIVGGVDLNRPVEDSVGILLFILISILKLLIWVAVLIPLWLPIMLIIRRKKKPQIE